MAEYGEAGALGFEAHGGFGARAVEGTEARADEGAGARELESARAAEGGEARTAEHAGATARADEQSVKSLPAKPTRPASQENSATTDPCIRAESEDDDGYDPYSDRRPQAEPLFERDPWA